jgi:hypothetical protein
MSAFFAFLLAMVQSPSRAAFTTVSVVLFWFFASWSIGLVPAFGAGFASAESVTAIQISLVEDAIIERRIRYCEAPAGSAVKRFFLKVVNQKVIQYMELTGLVNYNLPDCEEVTANGTDS